MDAGLDERRVNDVAIAVTEAATNVARHGGGGHVFVRALAEPRGVELVAVDSGPGMADLARSLRDGYSTAGTSGTGLGAIRRLADEFDLYSRPGAGTVLLARIRRTARTTPNAMATATTGAISVAAPGENVCGDGWGVEDAGAETRVCVVDGLGHGTFAHIAAEAALAVFRRQAMRSPAEVVQSMHLGLRATRGAAVAVARVDRHKREVRLSGVGNISAVVANASQQRSLASHNGIVGHEFRRAHEFTAPWDPGSVLILHSDGVSSRWRLDQYPGLVDQHPSVIAAVLYRDFARGRDDATVLVIRDAPTGHEK
jgi:anti-sigma regulatory factor (Ser/Thr protein kinase)